MSGWNMPPGVSTNDIPGNESNDAWEAELEAYIASHRDGVQTAYWRKPIPTGAYDWAAARDWENCVGYGSTKEEAIRELLTLEWENSDE